MKTLIAILLALSAAGCSAPAGPFAGASPADPSTPVAAVRYRSTTGSFQSQRPVEPMPWRDQNERVAPQPKSGQ